MARSMHTLFVFAAGVAIARVSLAAPPTNAAVASATPSKSVVPSTQAPATTPAPGAAPLAPAPAQSSAAATASGGGQSPPASPAELSPAGIAVLALAGAADAAWPLAQAVYADPSLRAAHLDEAHARVLCGESPRSDESPDLAELADMVAAVRGDDAPSRTLLAEIARRISVRALVVVRVDGAHPAARIYLPDTHAFDAATYEPDANGSLSWSGAVRSLARTLGVPQASAPALATHPVPQPDTHTRARPFYLSPWFWGALGVAAVAGGAAYLVTRDSGAPTIHLEVQVPHQ